MKFQTLVEKIKNPIRKQALKAKGDLNKLRDAEQLAIQWKEYIKYGVPEDKEDAEIMRKFKSMKMFPDRAERWLDQEAKKFGNQILRSKVESEKHTKIYSLMGIEVFLDESVNISFDKDSKNYENLDKSMKYLVRNIIGLIPNKKPKIVITNGDVNPLFKNPIGGGRKAAGITRGRIIYIEQYHVGENTVFVHEFAHMVAFLIPDQIEAMLERAYNEMLDIYWRGVKVKRRNVQPDNINDDYKYSKAFRWRKVIANKLGFKEYGLTNPDEFFASIIEHWNSLPNNSATYKYKSMVKNVLTRL
jgi:hypothetical protein